MNTYTKYYSFYLRNFLPFTMYKPLMASVTLHPRKSYTTSEVFEEG